MREECQMYAFGLHVWHWCLAQELFLCESFKHISVQLQKHLGSWPMNFGIIC